MTLLQQTRVEVRIDSNKPRYVEILTNSVLFSVILFSGRRAGRVGSVRYSPAKKTKNHLPDRTKSSREKRAPRVLNGVQGTEYGDVCSCSDVSIYLE